MNKIEALERVIGIVKDRQQDYGTASKMTQNIASMWTAYLGFPIEPYQVCMLNIMQKMMRLDVSQGNHLDSMLDIAGYAAIAVEISGEKASNEKQTNIVEERVRRQLDAFIIPSADSEIKEEATEKGKTK